MAQACGFNIFHGDAAIPSSGCYSRFMSKLAEKHKELRKIFKVLSKFCYDNMFGFEKHTIRGLKKMNTRVTLALILMLTFAVGKTVEKKPDEVRRFLSA